MMDYSKKKCVVCNRVGGIVQQPDGLYACKNCGTPYRPKRKAAVTAAKEIAEDVPPATDRFVWFDYVTASGVIRKGLYDCPRLPSDKVPVLHADTNKLAFYRYLREHGRLTRETEE